MAHISDYYPHGYCICDCSYNPDCHIHGIEGCLGCAAHPNGRHLPPEKKPAQSVSISASRIEASR